MKTKYKLVLSFDGHEYHGWQKQTSTEKTIQGVLETCLKKVFKQAIATTGSGRTDAKVHSINQHVVFEAPFKIEPNNLLLGLNSHLPASIRCIGGEVLKKELRATSDAKSRRYKYLFSTNRVATPFQRKYMTHIPYDLNFMKMEKAAQSFMGRHDFKSFMTQGSDPATTEREVFSISLNHSRETFHDLFPEHYYLEIEASGFLKQMVRLIVGSLFEVGKGKLTQKEIEEALRLADGNHIAPCAPPEGLFKTFVAY